MTPFAAWAIKDPTTQHVVSGRVRTSGTEEDVNAYRSELQGVYTLLLAISMLCKSHTIRSGSIRVACDNDKCIELARDPHLDVNVNSFEHADLIRAIRATTASLPLQVTFVKVKGHKDDDLPSTALTPMERLNCAMDHDAKELVLYGLLHVRATTTAPTAATTRTATLRTRTLAARRRRARLREERRKGYGQENYSIWLGSSIRDVI